MSQRRVSTDPSAPRDVLTVTDSRELRIIYRIAQETSAVLDLDALLPRIVDIIREVMGYYMVAVMLPADGVVGLAVGAQSGYAVDITGQTILPGQGITGWVFEHGTALIVHAGPDNFANIPSRYAPAPDATTLATGDAGAPREG